MVCARSGSSPVEVRVSGPAGRLARTACNRPLRPRYLLKDPILTLWLQIAQSRSYLCTLGAKVGIIYILAALGLLRYDSHHCSCYCSHVHSSSAEYCYDYYLRVQRPCIVWLLGPDSLIVRYFESPGSTMSLAGVLKRAVGAMGLAYSIHRAQYLPHPYTSHPKESPNKLWRTPE